MAEPGDPWAAVADVWHELWGGLADPVREVLLARTGVGRGTRVLDVGCGSGELLARALASGAVVTGVDPSPSMLAIAARTAVGATVVGGTAEHLPVEDGAFDVVLAVNSLQFADDPVAALHEVVRVLAPGGAVGLATWAEGSHNDLDPIRRAVAAAHEEEPEDGGPLRYRGGLERVMTDAGLGVSDAGLVDVLWAPADPDALVRGVLMGEDAGTMAELAPVVLAAAEPFRRGAGYRLVNRCRWAVGSRAS